MQKIEIYKTLNRVFNPNFWNCAKGPVTVSNAQTPEEIVKDVKKASAPKISLGDKYDKLKSLKAEDLKITQATIPDYILLFTGLGVISEGVAFVLKVPWYMPVVLFGCLIGFFVMRFKELRRPQEDYEY